MRRSTRVLHRGCSNLAVSRVWTIACEELERLVNAGASSSALVHHLNESPLTRLELYVRDDDGEHGIAETGAIALSRALALSPKVERLTMYGDGLSSKGASAIADAVRESVGLTHLFLYSAPIGAAGGAALGDALRSNASLEELDLSYCDVGTAGSDALANALRENTSLVRLNLQGNGIGTEANGTISTARPETFASLLAADTPLRHLGLTHNNLDEDSAAAMAEALASNGSLKFLDMRMNPLLADRTHAAFASLFDARQLASSEHDSELAVHIDGRGDKPKAKRKLPTREERATAREPVATAPAPRKSGIFLSYTT